MSNSVPTRALGYTSSAGPGFDTFGRIQIPIQPIDPAVGPPGDPALQVLLSYLQRFLVNDQNAAVAWRIPGVDPAHPPVNGVFPFDPQEWPFNAEALPSLYCWRDGGTIDWIADDWDVSTDTLKLLWVLPLTGPIESAIPSSTFCNGLIKAVNVAIERGRTQSWVVDGDPDTVAPIQGSFLGTFLNAYGLYLKGWKRTTVTALDADAKVVGRYPAIEMQLIFQETWNVDITGGGTTPTSEDNGVNAIVSNGQGTPMVQGFLAGTPVTD